MLATDAKASLPTKFDTKSPSTIPYTDMRAIIAMEGAVYLSSFAVVKCCERSVMVRLFLDAFLIEG